MPILRETYRLALKERDPEQYRALVKAGKLEAHVVRVVNDANAEIAQETTRVVLERGYHKLPPMEQIRHSNAAQAEVQEHVLAELLASL